VFVVGACAFLVYRALHPPQISQPQESPQSTSVKCDQSLWEFVYNPGRLQILDPCISVTGTVEEIRKEADGDVHILFRLDQLFESLLNEKNIARQYGDLVLEPICQGKVRQADAAEPCIRKPPSQTWRTFLENHVKSLVSTDFFVVPTITFKVLFGFVILAHDRRRPIHFAVTANPTAEWTARQLLEAFPWDNAPRYLLHDRDRSYGERFGETAGWLEIQEVLLRRRVLGRTRMSNA
jgi:hypothetical protein